MRVLSDLRAPRSPIGVLRPLLILAGIALVIVALAVACSAAPPPSVGSSAGFAAPSASVAGSGGASGAAPGAGSEAGSAGGVPVVSGALPSAAAVVRPVQLKIAKLGLAARVEAVGLDSTGDFAVPPSVDVVGWYQYGPGLGEPAGSVVIAGHVDSAQQGKGAFFKLRELAPGDAITVVGADGPARQFSVVAREIYQKTSIPLDRYFARDGAPRLTLITCGGPFDAQTRHYRDNVVVTAKPDGR
jgi:hypothetical protein